MEEKNGFTFIELAVAMTIMAILTAVFMPAALQWRTNQQLSQAARQVYADLQSARMQAVKHNRFAFVSFNVGAGTYVAWRDQGDNNGTLEATDAIILRNQMPPGVKITSVSFSGSNIISFSPMGLSRGLKGGLKFGRVIVANSARSSDVVVNINGTIRIE